MSLLFVDEPTIAELNERFLGARRPDRRARVPDGRRAAARRAASPTRAAAGPGAPADPGDPPTLLGDVVVCPAVAQPPGARARRSPADDELALLVVHGVLHLLDYDHAEAEEADVMRRREQELLARFRELEEKG